MRRRFPTAVNPRRVGKYPALVGAGGGYVWDDVLEYRVWVHAEEEDDFFFAFSSLPKARAFAARTPGAEEPLALVRQRQYVDEATPGRFVLVKKVRLAEWPPEFLARPRRSAALLRRFFDSGGDVDILRGLR